MRFLDSRTRASWCHREAGRVQDGLALRFLVGIGTDPLRRDTDLDVLGDPVLAPDYDRDVCDGGNDRPGFGPNHAVGRLSGNAVLNRKTIIVYSGEGCNPKEEVP